MVGIQNQQSIPAHLPAVPIAGLLAHTERDVGPDHLRIMNLSLGDHYFRPAGPAPRLWPIRLGLGDVLAVLDGRLGQQDAGQDSPLSAGTGQPHLIAPHHQFTSSPLLVEEELGERSPWARSII